MLNNGQTSGKKRFGVKKGDQKVRVLLIPDSPQKLCMMMQAISRNHTISSMNDITKCAIRRTPRLPAGSAAWLRQSLSSELLPPQSGLLCSELLCSEPLDVKSIAMVLPYRNGPSTQVTASTACPHLRHTSLAGLTAVGEFLIASLRR